MTLQIERVSVSKIMPLVDEYGNEFLNRDYTLEVNQAYVKELAASFGPSGEPDEPVKLVRDGGVFRIKAGNSRVRAMKELGTGECWAVIDDEDTVQSVLETVVRTNTKKKYEPIEEARFVQQLAMFGDDEYVGATASIGTEKAAQLRRARAMAGERAEQMTLKRLYVLSEFEEFPEIAEKVMSAEGDSWQYSIETWRRQKRDAVQRAEFTAKLKALKIEVAESRPEPPSAYVKDCYDTAELEATYMSVSATHKGIVAVLGSSWKGVYADFYGEPLKASKESPDEAERRRRAQALNLTLESIDRDTIGWVRGLIDEEGATAEGFLSKVPSLAEAARERFFNEYWVERCVKEMPGCKRFGTGVVDFAVGYMEERRINRDYGSFILKEGPLASGIMQRDMKRYLEFIELHIADGWQPDPVQSEAIEKLGDKCAEAVGDDDEDDDLL